MNDLWLIHKKVNGVRVLTMGPWPRMQAEQFAVQAAYDQGNPILESIVYELEKA